MVLGEVEGSAGWMKMEAFLRVRQFIRVAAGGTAAAER